MAKNRHKEHKEHTGAAAGAMELVKALFLAILFTLALILVFALIVRWVDVPDAVIVPVNQVIKGVSLMLACLISFRSGTGGWRKGLALGIVYVIAAWALFSALSGSFALDVSILWDLLTGAVMGLLCGAIAVNARKPVAQKPAADAH